MINLKNPPFQFKNKQTSQLKLRSNEKIEKETRRNIFDKEYFINNELTSYQG